MIEKQTENETKRNLKASLDYISKLADEQIAISHLSPSMGPKQMEEDVSPPSTEGSILPFMGMDSPIDSLEGPIANTDSLEGPIANTDSLEGLIANTDSLEGPIANTDSLEASPSRPVKKGHEFELQEGVGCPRSRHEEGRGQELKEGMCATTLASASASISPSSLTRT